MADALGVAMLPRASLIALSLAALIGWTACDDTTPSPSLEGGGGAGGGDGGSGAGAGEGGVGGGASARLTVTIDDPLGAELSAAFIVIETLSGERLEAQTGAQGYTTFEGIDLDDAAGVLVQ